MQYSTQLQVNKLTFLDNANDDDYVIISLKSHDLLSQWKWLMIDKWAHKNSNIKVNQVEA